MVKTSKPKFVSPKTKSLKAKASVATKAGHKIQKVKKTPRSLKPSSAVLKKSKADLLDNAVAATNSKPKKKILNKRQVAEDKQKPEVNGDLGQKVKSVRKTLTIDAPKSKLRKMQENATQCIGMALKEGNAPLLESEVAVKLESGKKQSIKNGGSGVVTAMRQQLSGKEKMIRSLAAVSQEQKSTRSMSLMKASAAVPPPTSKKNEIPKSVAKATKSVQTRLQLKAAMKQHAVKVLLKKPASEKSTKPDNVTKKANVEDVKDGTKGNKMVKFESSKKVKAKAPLAAIKPKKPSAGNLKTPKPRKSVKTIKKPKKVDLSSKEKKAKLVGKVPSILREMTDSKKAVRKMKAPKLLVAPTKAVAKRLRKSTTSTAAVERKAGGQSEVVKNDSSEHTLSASSSSELKGGAKEAAKKNTRKLLQPVAFDEKRFFNILNAENIKNICSKLSALVQQEVSKMPATVFDDYRYNLNITCYKIVNDPKRMVKLYLKHSLVDIGLDNIAIIVPDIVRGSKVNHEPTIQHYKEMFREAGVKGLTIIPFRQLRNEYSSYESLRKFANSYEYFLCDGRIVGHVNGHCGKIFQKTRTTIHALHLTNTSAFLREVHRVLKKTSYNNFKRGNMITIPVANHRHSIDKVAENIEFIIRQLKSVYPGGLANIRNIYIKINIKGTSSLPLYINLGGPPQQIANPMSAREQRMKKLQLKSKSVFSKFCITKGGELFKLSQMPGKLKAKGKIARKSATNVKTSSSAKNPKSATTK